MTKGCNKIPNILWMSSFKWIIFNVKKLMMEGCLIGKTDIKRLISCWDGSNLATWHLRCDIVFLSNNYPPYEYK